MENGQAYPRVLDIAFHLVSLPLSLVDRSLELFNLEWHH
jgi:hypothetical protein